MLFHKCVSVRLNQWGDRHSTDCIFVPQITWRNKSGPPLNRSVLRHKEPDALARSGKVSLLRRLCAGCGSNLMSLIITLKKTPRKGPKRGKSHSCTSLLTDSTVWICHQLQISPPATIEGGLLHMISDMYRGGAGQTEIQSERSCSDISWPAFSSPEEILSSIYCYKEKPGWFLPVTLFHPHPRPYFTISLLFPGYFAILQAVTCLIVSKCKICRKRFLFHFRHVSSLKGRNSHILMVEIVQIWFFFLLLWWEQDCRQDFRNTAVRSPLPQIPKLKFLFLLLNFMAFYNYFFI